MAKALDFPDKIISYALIFFLASWVAVLSLAEYGLLCLPSPWPFCGALSALVG